MSERVAFTGAEMWEFAANWLHLPSGCVVWTGKHTSSGYGLFRYRGKLRIVSQLYLEVRLSRKLLPGMVAMHQETCPRNCILHVTEGTFSENTKSAYAAGKITKYLAIRDACSNGHHFSPENTTRRSDQPTVRVCRKCLSIKSAEYRKRKKERNAADSIR